MDSVRVVNHCAKILDEVVLFQFQVLGRQLFIWVGDRTKSLANLHMGIPSNDSCSTCIFGDLDSPGADLVAKLSKSIIL